MKSFVTTFSILFLVLACSSAEDEMDVSFSNLGSEEYPQMFYMEYVPCQEGVYYTAENFRNEVLPDWQDLLVGLIPLWCHLMVFNMYKDYLRTMKMVFGN